ncbi:30S ribosomal protein S4 [Chloroflexota bacterium]
MARYTGPVCKLCRRYGDKLLLKGGKCLTPKCPVEKRHGSLTPRRGIRRRNNKVTEYGLQLREKQKARLIYGILERHFVRNFAEAKRRPGRSGENLFVMLEMRLDNVVYRLGFTDSRRQARQIVRHGHIAVNERMVNIPSYQVKLGDAISWKKGSSAFEQYTLLSKDVQGELVPNWLTLDQTTFIGQVISAPSLEDIAPIVDDQLIVSYYSR